MAEATGCLRLSRASDRGLESVLCGPLETGFWAERAHTGIARNEKAVKSLKTNNPAKSLIQRS